MPPATFFRAIHLSRNSHGQFCAAIRTVPLTSLVQATPDADVTLAVSYSSMNYKDGLALTDTSPVIRQWPMVAGIDAVGRVLESRHARWRVGDRAILNGWGAGESHWGGLAERVRVRSDWLVALPAAFTELQAMAIGTAGYTAALSVLALERFGVNPSQGEVLVTGATGGVGSIAVALLSARGFRVTAATGKLAQATYLQQLGATAVIDRSALGIPGKPLQKERWAATIDTVGSHTLANACAQCQRGGVVAACGLAQGMDFPATVAPFILRGVSLLGIDSAMAPLPQREAAWALLAQCLDPIRLETMTQIVGLAECFDTARALVAGRVRGRVVVDVNR